MNRSAGATAPLFDMVRCFVAFAVLATLAFLMLYPDRRHTNAQMASTFAVPEAELAYDPGTRDVAFDNGDSAANAAICVIGTATSGVEKLFTYNERGRGKATAAFQIDADGGNINVFNLYKGVTLSMGTATDAACKTGSLVASRTVSS